MICLYYQESKAVGAIGIGAENERCQLLEAGISFCGKQVGNESMNARLFFLPYSKPL
jgi:hypothetical protein